MLIFAWNDYSVTEILRKDLLYSLSSVFVTAAFLQFLQSMFPFNMPFFSLERTGELRVIALIDRKKRSDYKPIPWLGLVFLHGHTR